MGRRKLNKIVVIDIESTAWQNEDGSKIPPEGMRNDIIEIGACLLDTQSGEITQKTSYIIKPRNSTMSPFITKLTSLTQKDVDKGIPFSDACNKFIKEFGSKNKVCAGWGEYDRQRKDAFLFDARDDKRKRIGKSIGIFKV